MRLHDSPESASVCRSPRAEDFGLGAHVDVSSASNASTQTYFGGADRSALRKRCAWRCPRNGLASVLVLISTPDLALTERQGGAGPVRGLPGGKDPTGRLRSRPPERRAGSTSLLDLSRVLEPLLVVGGLLPPLVGGAGAGPVPLRAPALTALPGGLAGAAGPQTEVPGCEFSRAPPRPRDEVAALKSDLAFHRTGVLLAPEPVPVGKIQAAFPVEGLPARHEPEHGRARPIDILRLV